jgi:plastocyanin
MTELFGNVIIIRFTCALFSILYACSSPSDKPKPEVEEEFDAPVKANTETAGTEHVIEIKAMQFVPDELTIHKGDKVTWINHDIVDHDITEKNKAWASSRMTAGTSWSMVVTKNEDYFCNLHVVMKGKIIAE